MLDLNEPTNPFPCPNCQENCEENAHCICCEFCSNWFHDECLQLSKTKLNQIRHNNVNDFMCFLCKNKKNCYTCHVPVRATPSSNSVYCVKCKVVLCQNCSDCHDGELSKFNTSDEVFFYCQECSHDQYCGACSKICEDDCIMCDYCKNWIHYKCSKLTKKQTNRYHQTLDKYFCQSCRYITITPFQ